MNEINKLQFDTEPSYAKILSKINDTLKSLGNDSTDNFYAFNQKSSSKTPSKVTHFSLLFNSFLSNRIINFLNRKK